VGGSVLLCGASKGTRHSCRVEIEADSFFLTRQECRVSFGIALRPGGTPGPTVWGAIDRTVDRGRGVSERGAFASAVRGDATFLSRENQEGDHQCPPPPILSTSTATSTSIPLSGPVLPTICALYRKSRWQVSNELSKIFKAANITTSVKLEGRNRKTPEATFHSLRHTLVSFAGNAHRPVHRRTRIDGNDAALLPREHSRAQTSRRGNPRIMKQRGRRTAPTKRFACFALSYAHRPFLGSNSIFSGVLDGLSNDARPFRHAFAEGWLTRLQMRGGRTLCHIPPED